MHAFNNRLTVLSKYSLWFFKLLVYSDYKNWNCSPFCESILYTVPFVPHTLMKPLQDSFWSSFLKLVSYANRRRLEWRLKELAGSWHRTGVQFSNLTVSVRGNAELLLAHVRSPHLLSTLNVGVTSLNMSCVARNEPWKLNVNGMIHNRTIATLCHIQGGLKTIYQPSRALLFIQYASETCV